MMARGGARTAARQLWRLWTAPASMASSGSRLPPVPSCSSSSLSFSSSSGHGVPRFFPVSPAILGLLGASAAGLLEWAHADTGEGGEGTGGVPASSNSASGEPDALERLVRAERQRLEELLKSRGMQRGTYPLFSVSAKGQKITVKFRIPPTCEVSHLIVDLVSHLGLKAEQHGGGSEMLVRTWDSAVAWQLTLNPLEGHKEIAGGFSSGDREQYEGNLCILIFESLVSSDNCEIEFIKEGTFSSEELDALVSALKLAGEKAAMKKSLGRKPGKFTREKQNTPQMEKTISSLESMGVRVYGIDESYGAPSNCSVSWDNIAGYEQQKREIEDTIVLALQSPQVYDEIARATRRKFETNRPRAVLFEGPPGTGKTSCARVIANQAGVPLLYVPLEVVMSKFYGESERLLGTVFTLANELPNGAIIFLDEIDSFAASRDSEMHEATRRILSVLLRQIDGFEQEKSVVVIAATNRKQDLDPALISRFDTMIPFSLPDQHNREEITAQYAKHLKGSELAQLAEATEGMSGRDIRDICQQAERCWASKLIRGHAASDSADAHLPPLEEYIKCAEVRRRTLLEVSEKRNRTSGSNPVRDRGLLAVV